MKSAISKVTPSLLLQSHLFQVCLRLVRKELIAIRQAKVCTHTRTLPLSYGGGMQSLCLVALSEKVSPHVSHSFPEKLVSFSPTRKYATHEAMLRNLHVQSTNGGIHETRITLGHPSKSSANFCLTLVCRGSASLMSTEIQSPIKLARLWSGRGSKKACHSCSDIHTIFKRLSETEGPQHVAPGLDRPAQLQSQPLASYH